MRTESLMGLPWLALLAGIFLAGCGGPGGQTGGGDGSSDGPGAVGSPESVEVAGGQALLWGEGTGGRCWRTGRPTTRRAGENRRSD